MKATTVNAPSSASLKWLCCNGAGGPAGKSSRLNLDGWLTYPSGNCLTVCQNRRKITVQVPLSLRQKMRAADAVPFAGGGSDRYGRRPSRPSPRSRGPAATRCSRRSSTRTCCLSFIPCVAAWRRPAGDDTASGGGGAAANAGGGGGEAVGPTLWLGVIRAARSGQNVKTLSLARSRRVIVAAFYFKIGLAALLALACLASGNLFGRSSARSPRPRSAACCGVARRSRRGANLGARGAARRAAAIFLVALGGVAVSLVFVRVVWRAGRSTRRPAGCGGLSGDAAGQCGGPGVGLWLLLTLVGRSSSWCDASRARASSRAGRSARRRAAVRGVVAGALCGAHELGRHARRRARHRGARLLRFLAHQPRAAPGRPLRDAARGLRARLPQVAREYFNSRLTCGRVRRQPRRAGRAVAALRAPRLDALVNDSIVDSALALRRSSAYHRSSPRCSPRPPAGGRRRARRARRIIVGFYTCSVAGRRRERRRRDRVRVPPRTPPRSPRRAGRARRASGGGASPMASSPCRAGARARAHAAPVSGCPCARVCGGGKRPLWRAARRPVQAA